MKIIDLTTKTQPLQVRLDPSPVYDLLAAMYLVENWTPGREFEIDRRWVGRARVALGPALRKDLRLFGRERGFLMGLVSLLEHRPGLSVEEFLRELAATPHAVLIERMLTAPRAARQAAPLVREALLHPSDHAVKAAVNAYPAEFDGARVRTILVLGAAAGHARVAGVIRAFYEQVYRADEPAVVPTLRADVEAKRTLAATVSAMELVERASGGTSISPDSEITHIVLAPTYHFRPYNLISEYPGARVVIYPVASDTADPASAAHEVTRLFKALGDDTRLRILQLLTDREMYLQEIANHLGVSHVTAIHHLALLRAAHLVRVVVRQNKNFYQLRPDIAAEVTERLSHVLTRTELAKAEGKGG